MIEFNSSKKTILTLEPSHGVIKRIMAFSLSYNLDKKFSKN